MYNMTLDLNKQLNPSDLMATYKCTIPSCGISYETDPKRVLHEILQHPPKKCPFCDLADKRKYEFTNHMEKAHKSSALSIEEAWGSAPEVSNPLLYDAKTGLYSCNLCGTGFRSTFCRADHLQNHDKRAYCCGAEFKTSSEFAKHMKEDNNHIGTTDMDVYVWPHVCQDIECNEGFKYFSQLERHKGRTHMKKATKATKAKKAKKATTATYPCTFMGCTAIFPLHLKQKHEKTHTPVVKRGAETDLYHCNICPQTLTRDITFADHMKKHNREKEKSNQDKEIRKTTKILTRRKKRQIEDKTMDSEMETTHFDSTWSVSDRFWLCYLKSQRYSGEKLAMCTGRTLPACDNMIVTITNSISLILEFVCPAKVASHLSCDEGWTSNDNTSMVSFMERTPASWEQVGSHLNKDPNVCRAHWIVGTMVWAENLPNVPGEKDAEEWTCEEENLLLEMRSQCRDWFDIAATLKRNHLECCKYWYGQNLHIDMESHKYFPIMKILPLLQEIIQICQKLNCENLLASLFIELGRNNPAEVLAKLREKLSFSP